MIIAIAASSLWSVSGRTGQLDHPEASALLNEVDHVVGYGPYLDRLPPDRLSNDMAPATRSSWNVARHALDLALAGERTAVVSGGDAGIFGMAAAVLRRPPTTDMPGSPSPYCPG
jgi:precorrin-2 C20-methyltransferase/precorrin-3B C17-methyltransferase